MLAAQDVAERCKQIGINALHVKLRATGGTAPDPGPGAQSALRAWPALACALAALVCSVTRPVFPASCGGWLMLRRAPAPPHLQRM